MLEVETFAQASKQAEEIVTCIKDPALRAAAFQVLLPRLLDQSEPATDHRTENRPVALNVPVEKTHKSETKNRILELRASGFFAEPRSSTEVRERLRTDGYHHNGSDVRMALLRLAQKKELRRLQDGRGDFRYAQP
jgi:hypothetical protein